MLIKKVNFNAIEVLVKSELLQQVI